MAKSTIYPYGTNGELPSSIGLVDNLTTGGVDKALTAEQGKVIGEIIVNGIWEEIDTTSITVQTYCLGSRTWYLNGSKGKHIVVPVTPGDTYKFKPTTTVVTAGNFYSWLTSAYVVPTSSSTIPYVSGYGRIWAEDSAGWIQRTAPEGAAYLCLNIQNGDNGVSTWEVSKLQEQSLKERVDGHDVDIEDIKSEIVAIESSDRTIPDGLTKRSYNGEVYSFSNSHKFGFEWVFDISNTDAKNWAQGGACYGDYYFQFRTGNSQMFVYDLSNAVLLEVVSIPTKNRGFVSNCHCNTVNFGQEFYDPSDEFPLLYVSTGYASDGYTGAIVYRVQRTEDSEGVSSFSLTLVQTIKISGTGWTEFITAGDFCYVRTGGGAATGFYRFRMPKLADGDVTFSLEDALTFFPVASPSFTIGSGQGQLYHNGKIFFVAGIPSSQNVNWFLVIDLATGTYETVIDLLPYISSEPESVFIWRENLCIAFRNQIRRLYFER